MRDMQKRLWALVAAAVVSAIPAAAGADSPTFNAIFFHPATGRNTYLMLQGTETLHQMQFDVGEYFSYGWHPLDIRTTAGSRVQGVISQLVVSDFTAAIGATDWLQFGLDVPVVLINSFREPDAVQGAPTANHFNLSDIRFEAKGRFLDACKTRIGLALVPFVTFPTGSDAHYVGDPGFTGGATIALDGKVSRKIGLTLNVGYQGGRKVKISNVEFQHRLLLGGGIQGNIFRGLDVFGEINAIAAFNKLLHDRDMNPTEFMAGARWDVGKTGLTVQGGAGTCLVCGVKGARIRAVAGLKYRLSTPKYRQLEDQRAGVCTLRGYFSKSRLYELKQNCPQKPEDYVQGVHDDACPKYYELQELAGLILKCPVRPEDFNPSMHDPACQKVYDMPDEFSPADVRNIVSMAVAEMSLICPADPTNFNAQIHDAACPKYYDLKETEALASRCPSNADDYKEGVDDPSCPKYYTLREAYGDIDWNEVNKLRSIDLDRYGSAILGGEIQTLRPVYFDFAKSNLLPTMLPVLDQVIRVINETPWVSVVRIGGHADARGTVDANEKISMKRSQTVIDYMKSHGVRSDVQLIPVAYGSYRPAASNETEEGRALNRRVIFTVSSYKIPKYTPSAIKKASAAPAPSAPMGETPSLETGAEPVKEGEPQLPPSRWSE